MKNYTIIRIAPANYFSVMESWLQENPEFYTSSYDEMLKRFFNSSIMYSDGFSRSFKELGQDAHDIIADFNIVQKQWARENGIKFDSGNWMTNILMAQIEKIKPDIVYLQGNEWGCPGWFSPHRPNDNLIKILKEKFSFIRKIIVYSGYPSPARWIQDADLFFSSPPSINDAYRKMGLEPILLYHTFDDGILSKLNGSGKEYNFTFAGSSRAPESRYWALRQLLEKTDLKVWVNEQKENKNDKTNNYNIKKQLRYAIKSASKLLTDQQINVLSSSNNIPDKIKHILKEISVERKGPTTLLSELYQDHCFPALIGLDMYNLLHQSKITFNMHAEQSFGDVGNMRMFEATGVGTCLLTDTGNNMQDLFEPDKEVVTYSCVDEAIEKATYLLDHPDEAEQIAKAGQARTLKDHTILNRCQQIDEVIQSKL